MTAAAHQERLMTILQGPHFSEKSTLATEMHIACLRRDGR